MRRQEIERKKALRDAMVKGKKAKASKPKKEKAVNADINGDGKVDEEDLSLVHKAYDAAKKVKKIVKK